MKKIFKFILLIALLIISLLCVFLGYIHFNEYKPAEIEDLEIINNTKSVIDTNTDLSLLSYNVSYSILDENAEYYFEGGLSTKAYSKKRVENNLNSTSDFLVKNNYDFIMLQDVDVESKRSYKINQFNYVQNKLKNYGSIFNPIHKVSFIPYPINMPLGQVYCGDAVFFKYRANSSERYALPSNKKWPMKMFDQKKAFSTTEFYLSNGKKLILLNFDLNDNSTNDKAKLLQIKEIKNYIEGEYKKGNYIIAGGNFGYILHDSPYKCSEGFPQGLSYIPKDFKMKNFKFVYDTKYPTFRSASMPYIKDKNFTSITDGFLVSDNIKVLNISTVNLGFKNSNHNPVQLKFRIK
ncbi:MAG TPA: hypothetical protein DEF85_00420 [Clostridiaceae bacterium]|mgnify:CR=1 FL=1|jgi:hypothetical protein|nr:hypothetical protein [Clostridiaceae bacterium]HBF77509.1 hypothetical protein [Clostridiaceae bacterium]HBG39174.1 hypothetical protein [Clostridiaceae bacterium]HBN29488.1 hypothetical protein [Clostridiaceae bacterium]HBX47354.1 hypothetical protein [Clostridiaceae bacterium]